MVRVKFVCITSPRSIAAGYLQTNEPDLPVRLPSRICRIAKANTSELDCPFIQYTMERKRPDVSAGTGGGGLVYGSERVPRSSEIRWVAVGSAPLCRRTEEVTISVLR